MYKSLIYWYDKQDDMHHYEPGQDYPRRGAKATRARIKELTDKQIIEKIKED